MVTRSNLLQLLSAAVHLWSVLLQRERPLTAIEDVRAVQHTGSNPYFLCLEVVPYKKQQGTYRLSPEWYAHTVRQQVPGGQPTDCLLPSSTRQAAAAASLFLE
jgi:hypothetical protein